MLQSQMGKLLLDKAFISYTIQACERIYTSLLKDLSKNGLCPDRTLP